MQLSPRAYQRITLLAVVALGFIIVTGGAVRLTGSGLGCPKWPTCTSGHVVAPAHIRPWVEFGNRLVTGIVSVAVILAALGAFWRTPRRRDLTWLASGLVVGVLAQIVLGGETVRHQLEPGYVMAHFLLSMLLVWDAVVLHHRASSDTPSHSSWLGSLVVLLASITITIGTVVTGSGPHSGASNGDKVAARWHLDVHRITQIHGTSAMVLALVAIGLFVRLRSAPAQHLVSALGFQVAVGYTQYFSRVPPVLVGMHILGAVLVWVAALRLALTLPPTTAPVPVRVSATIG